MRSEQPDFGKDYCRENIVLRYQEKQSLFNLKLKLSNRWLVPQNGSNFFKAHCRRPTESKPDRKI